MSQYISAGTSARIKVANADSMQLTFELTMTLGEWKIMARDLEDDEGDARKRLRRMIGEMIGGAAKAVDQTYSTTGWSGFNAADQSKDG